MITGSPGRTRGGTSVPGLSGGELERLQAEWEQLDQRRSRLGASAASKLTESNLSLSALQPAARLSPSRSPPFRSRSPAGRITTLMPDAEETEESRSRLEVERAELRAALTARSRISPKPRGTTKTVHAVGGRALEEQLRELREKLRVMTEEKEQAQMQLEHKLADSQRETSMLKTNLRDKEQEVTELKMQLQRADVAAKQSHEMWTQVSGKQQATLTTTHQEKSVLYKKVDELKEELATLRAKNQSLIHQSKHTANVAFLDAEIVLLRKERAGLEADLELLQGQSKIALQQLDGKTEELRLALLEASSLRTQVQLLAEQVEQQNVKLEAADAMAQNAKQETTAILQDGILSSRKCERVCLLAGRCLYTSILRRAMNQILRHWGLLNRRKLYLKTLVKRLRGRRARDHLQKHVVCWRILQVNLFRDRLRVYQKRIASEKRVMHLHLRALNSLIRQSKRFGRLKQSWKQAIKCSCFVEWHDFINTWKGLYLQDLRLNAQLLRITLKAWISFVYEARKHQAARKWSTRLFLQVQRGHAGTIFSAWKSTTNQHKWTKKVLQSLTRSSVITYLRCALDDWIELVSFERRARYIMRSALSRTLFRTFVDILHHWRQHVRHRKALQKWCNVACYRIQYTHFSWWADWSEASTWRCQQTQHKFDASCMRFALRTWHKHFTVQRWANKLLPQFCTKFEDKLTASSFLFWKASTDRRKKARNMVEKTNKRAMSEVFSPWVEICAMLQRMERALHHLLQRSAFESRKISFVAWQNITSLCRALRVRLDRQETRSKLSRMRRNFTQWHCVKVNGRLIFIILKNQTRHTTAKFFRTWLELHDMRSHLVRNAQTAFLRWFLKGIRLAFDQWVCTVSRNRICRRSLLRYFKVTVLKTFEFWWEKTEVRRKLTTMVYRKQRSQQRQYLCAWTFVSHDIVALKASVRRVQKRRVLSIWNRWYEARSIQRRIRKVERMRNSMIMNQSLQAWEQVVILRRHVNKILKALIHAKTDYGFRAWFVFVCQIKSARVMQKAMRVPILHQTKKHALERWIEWRGFKKHQRQSQEDRRQRLEVVWNSWVGLRCQLKVAKVWNVWQRLTFGRAKRQSLIAHAITHAVCCTAKALYLSSVMRQWLCVAIVPASDAELAIVRKMSTRILRKYFSKYVEWIGYVREVGEISKDALIIREKDQMKAIFLAFRFFVARCVQTKQNLRDAIAKYRMQLMADSFYDLRDDVLQFLMLDEKVYQVVHERTFSAYLRSGFEAFMRLLQRSRIFRERALAFRGRRIDVIWKNDGIQSLHAHVQECRTENQRIVQKCQSWGKRRSLRNFCHAVQEQSVQYAEAKESLRTTYHRWCLRSVFDEFFDLTYVAGEIENKARTQFEMSFKIRFKRTVIHALRRWVAHTRDVENAALRLRQSSLLRVALEAFWGSALRSVDPGLLKQVLRRNQRRNTLRAFTSFVSTVRNRQLLYHAYIQTQKRCKRQCIRLHALVWYDIFVLLKARRKRLMSLHRQMQLEQCHSFLSAWYSVCVRRVWLGNKLLLIRKRFFSLHVKAPAMNSWKYFLHDIKRRLHAYIKIVRAVSFRQLTALLEAWMSLAANRTLTLRALQGIILRKRFRAFRMCLNEWTRNVDKRMRAGRKIDSRADAFLRKHMQLWRALVLLSQNLQERARTCSVIIKICQTRHQYHALKRGLRSFIQNVLGRGMPCSLFRRAKWQHLRAVRGSLMQRAFFTWRRHWINHDLMGEALRRVLSQRREKVDLHQPFWAWLRYLEDKLNIRREAALVRKTSKILTDVLDVYGEPFLSDFSVRAERAFTLDHLIGLLKRYQQHHSDLKMSAKMQGSAPPRVLTHGPVPYSHHITTIGKQGTSKSLNKGLGLSPPSSSPQHDVQRELEFSTNTPLDVLK